MTPTFRGYDSFYGYYSGSQVSSFEVNRSEEYAAFTLPGALTKDYYTHKDSGFDLHLDIGRNCGPNCSIARLDQNGIYSPYLYAGKWLCGCVARCTDSCHM